MTLGAAVFARSARVAHGKGAAATGTRHVRAQPPDSDRKGSPTIDHAVGQPSRVAVEAAEPEPGAALRAGAGARGC